MTAPRVCPSTCAFCGKVADPKKPYIDLRPYGPRGEWICWACGQKDPQTTQRQMKRVEFGRVEH
jgi:hypothetical protein